nr:PREDICTED: huntingtin-interacting protein 1 [Anolis carolinensis]|eukprot:XP_008123834.1 PREDICTED: huntingtin-interacting protein 1 [Anolis carolinensis]
MSRMWGHLSEGYGQLCSVYLKLLRTKMEFHTKNPRFPGNLQMSDRQLDETGENDVNNFFQLTVEMFDYLECELTLFQTVFSSLDMSRSVSVTAAGQCRLAPLIQVILDSSHLYDYTVKLLFKLHSCLPAETLQGHRDRFLGQFKKLKELFYRSSNLQYFKRLIQIPHLPENPPNFLRASALSEHISPVVVIPAEASSPDSEPIMDLAEAENASQQSLFDNKFDDIFGTSFGSGPFNFNAQNGMSRDEKDRLIEHLQREIASLKEELSSFRAESQCVGVQLRGRVSELEAELAEERHRTRRALDEGEFLRAEAEDLKRRHHDTQRAQRSLTEIERKAQATGAALREAEGEVQRAGAGPRGAPAQERGGDQAGDGGPAGPGGGPAGPAGGPAKDPGAGGSAGGLAEGTDVQPGGSAGHARHFGLHRTGVPHIHTPLCLCVGLYKSQKTKSEGGKRAGMSMEATRSRHLASLHAHRRRRREAGHVLEKRGRVPEECQSKEEGREGHLNKKGRVI